MVASMAAEILRRGLDSGPTSDTLYSNGDTTAARAVTTACACLSIIAGSLAFVWFAQMERKFRHTLIMTLILADLVKDLNYASFSIVLFAKSHLSSTSAYCQVSGFVGLASIEITDFSVLLIVMHMSLQILHPSFAEEGLERFRHTILTLVFVIAILMASLAFLNPLGGYQLTGAFCSLPIRPFWYRLTLGWIERYIIAIVIVALTIVIRIKVKSFQQTLARLQRQGHCAPQRDMEDDIIEESDEIDSGVGRNTSEKSSEDELIPHNEKQAVVAEDDGSDTVPDDEHMDFNSDDLARFKRQSFRKRPSNIITGGSDLQQRVVSVAISAAPSSAIFSPYRDSFRIQSMHNMEGEEMRSSSVIDMPARRQSVAVFDAPRRGMSAIDMPRRRASLVDTTTNRSSMIGSARGGDRSSAMLPPPSRRSSIWDEIDASLDKKYANNRVSVLSGAPLQQNDFPSAAPSTSLPPLPSANRNSVIHNRSSAIFNNRSSMLMSPLSSNPTTAPSHPTALAPTAPSKRSSFRNSKLYDTARRTLSVISRAHDTEEDPNSPTAILTRRHRFIQRQMRYLILYPFVYLGLWFCPFVLHCMQYSDRYANAPPPALVLLSLISLSIFGFANSLVFCLREKPWTLIEHSDGTVWGSLRPGFLMGKMQRTRGPEADIPDWIA